VLHTFFRWNIEAHTLLRTRYENVVENSDLTIIYQGRTEMKYENNFPVVHTELTPEQRCRNTNKFRFGLAKLGHSLDAPFFENVQEKFNKILVYEYLVHRSQLHLIFRTKKPSHRPGQKIVSYYYPLYCTYKTSRLVFRLALIINEHERY